jgi:Methyltransferase domain
MTITVTLCPYTPKDYLFHSIISAALFTVCMTIEQQSTPQSLMTKYPNMRVSLQTVLFTVVSFCPFLLTSGFPFLPVPSRVPGYRLPIALMGSMAEKVLERPQFPAEWPYSEQDFARMDESNDAVFYDSARLVYHIDDAAVAALTKYYSENLKDGEDVLDICSSWVSHYPKDFKGGKVVGLGMNEYELSQNRQLTDYVVKDLNADPVLPFEDTSFDKVTCVVSVDYLNKPLEIFKEIGRVLRPGGECIISMSNRCFPTKAFQVRNAKKFTTSFVIVFL